MADRILISESLQVLRSRLCRNLRNICFLWRRYDIKRITETNGRKIKRTVHIRSRSLPVKPDGHFSRLLAFLTRQICLTERSLYKAILTILRSPNHHIALTCRKKGLAILSRIFRHDRTKLCIIIDFKIHSCTLYRLAVSINYREVDTGRGAIIVYQIDFCIVGRAEHYLFRSVIVAKRLRMHQHGSRCGSIKPCQIKHSLRFAST